MRVNLPVTHVERTLRDGEYIVSKTDLKGRIVYVNRPFVEISGFTEEELLGRAHNIVRHPDMPPAAYADLWRGEDPGEEWSRIAARVATITGSKPMPIRFGKMVESCGPACWAA